MGDRRIDAVVHQVPLGNRDPLPLSHTPRSVHQGRGPGSGTYRPPNAPKRPFWSGLAWRRHCGIWLGSSTHTFRISMKRISSQSIVLWGDWSSRVSVKEWKEDWIAGISRCSGILPLSTDLMHPQPQRGSTHHGLAVNLLEIVLNGGVTRGSIDRRSKAGMHTKGKFFQTDVSPSHLHALGESVEWT